MIQPSQPLHPKSSFEKLSTFMLVWMGCFLFAALAVNGLMALSFGLQRYNEVAQGAVRTSGELMVTKIALMLSTICAFALPSLVFVFIQKPRNWQFLRLNKKPLLGALLLAPLIVVLCYPLITWALEINQQMTLPAFLQQLENLLRDAEEESAQLVNQMLAGQTGFDFALNFLMLAIIPAIAEELLFRGGLQQLLEEWFGNAHIAIFMTGAIFSFIHFQFFGFLPRMMMGVLLGYLFYWSRNLWLPIFAHFIFNGVQVAIVYLHQTGRVEFSIDESHSFPPYVTMIATVLLFGAVFIFDRLTQQNRATS